MIVWDEFLSQNTHCLTAAMQLLDDMQGKILLCMGDCRQIAPVVQHSSNPFDTLRSSPLSSHYWRRFQIYEFTRNMRLSGLQNSPDSPAYRSQSTFANTLLCVGNADYTADNLHCQLLHKSHTLPFTCILRLPGITTFTDTTTTLAFLYPSGFNTEGIEKRAILAVTNEICDEWNALIQSTNPNPGIAYFSSNTIADVDDINGHLATMISPYVLSKFEAPNVPPHEMYLKVGDICLIMRTIGSKTDQISTNTRVKIVLLSTNSIRVQTLGDNQRLLTLPRIKFKVRLPYGHSFYMLRTQFPLRLAYSMTFNKSQVQTLHTTTVASICMQGQEFDRVVLDSVQPVFSHGFLYVGMSRVRHSQTLAFYTKPDNLVEGAVIVHNVVYPHLLLKTTH